MSNEGVAVDKDSGRSDVDVTSKRFRTLSSRTIFQDPFLSLHEDLVGQTQGDSYVRKVLEYQPASVVLPIDDKGRMLLIRHYRHPIGRDLWEVPGGMVADGESAEVAALRELREETGYRAGRTEHLIRFHPEPAFADHRIDVFRGTELTYDAADRQREQDISRVQFFTAAQARELILSNEIASSWTLIAIMCGEYRSNK